MFGHRSYARFFLDTILVDEKIELQTALDTYDINDNKISLDYR